MLQAFSCKHSSQGKILCICYVYLCRFLCKWIHVCMCLISTVTANFIHNFSCTSIISVRRRRVCVWNAMWSTLRKVNNVLWNVGFTWRWWIFCLGRVLLSYLFLLLNICISMLFSFLIYLFLFVIVVKKAHLNASKKRPK